MVMASCSERGRRHVVVIVAKKFCDVLSKIHKKSVLLFEHGQSYQIICASSVHLASVVPLPARSTPVDRDTSGAGGRHERRAHARTRPDRADSFHRVRRARHEVQEAGKATRKLLPRTRRVIDWHTTGKGAI